MRLNCPNCGAQYEVPDEVIPQAGRDVQCSSCGNTWFQVHPDADNDLADDLGAPVADETWSPDDDVERAQKAENDSVAAQEEPTPEGVYMGDELPAAAPVQSDSLYSEDNVDLDDEEAYQDTRALHIGDAPQEELPEYPEDDNHNSDFLEESTQPTRRALDPEIADVLKQEAEHEVQARLAEADTGLESQPDLGLAPPPTESEKRALAARARMTRMRGLPTETVDTATAPTDVDPTGSRRDLLPDIEEINSTLRSTGDRHPENNPYGASPSMRRRRGFRLGFGLVFLTAAMILLAYIYHEDIVIAQPQTAPYITKFMAWANDARLWLDTQMTHWMLWLQSKTGTH